MHQRVKRLVALSIAVTVIVGAGFGAGAAADDAEQVDETPRMHDRMHSSSGAPMDGSPPRGVMDAMHAEMSRQMAPQQRELHDRMHDECTGTANERNNT